MCGIVGFVGPQEDAWVTRMNAVQTHRGPDASGEWRERQRQVTLAMRRLAIVDLSEGAQPMADEGEQHVLVFNGEIFNAAPLRRELEQSGCRFRTDHSDTEVILHGYRVWGERVLDRLNGMFAFVIYDRQQDSLFGARDPAGIKPLYLLHTGQQLAFASELKSLRELPSVGRSVDALDLESLSHYLTLQFVPAPRTILRQVQKLPAGHCFRYARQDATLRVRSYWAPPAPATTPIGARDGDVVEAVRERVVTAVRDWLMSDVPVGCSLSGGVDSAAVVGVMGSLGIQPLRTWTLGFSDSTSDQDERNLARLVARRWGTEHTEVVISARDVLDDLPAMVRALDEPYGGGLPSWYIFRAMHGHIKVAMTGTGGDELFGNYGKWRGHRLASRRGLRNLSRSVREHGVRRVLQHRHGALYHGYTGDRRKRGLLSPHIAAIGSTARLMQEHWRAVGRSDPKDAVAAVDFRLQLPDEFLHMTDRFSMAWSIEARTPFLDRALVEYVLSLPAAVRIDAESYKGLLKRAAAAWVPPELLSAGKRGFVLPMTAWTRNELKPLLHEVLGAAFLRQQGLFDAAGVGDVLAAHLDGRQDATDLIWTLLMFQLWWQSFSAADSQAAPHGARCA